MSRIVVFVSNPCVNDARVIKMARAAADASHDVHVFATLGANAIPWEKVDGVTYHRMVWSPAGILSEREVLKWVGLVSKRLRKFLLAKLSPFVKYRLFSQVFSPHAIRVKPDIVHAHDLICLPAGFDVAQACGAKLVYDAHELEVHRNPPLPFLQKLFVGYIERKYARRADAVNTVGDLVCKELSAHIGRNDVQVLYNSPPLNPCVRCIRQDLQIDDGTPLMLYVGKVAIGRGVDSLLSLLPKMPGVVFATVGPCDAKSREKLEVKARQLSVASRFRILPPVPFDQVVSYIRGADIGVISVEPVTLSYRYCMPNKLFELSFANIPIISNELDDIERYLSEFGNGRVVNLSDNQSICYNIFKIIKNKDEYKIKDDVMKTMFDRYSWDAQSRKLIKTYESLSGGVTHDV